MLETTQGN